MPRLPRAAWVVLVGDAVSAIGTGLTLPFLIIYFHDVRGIDLALAGFALSMVGFASLVGNPTGGALADRLGARRTLILGTLISAAGAMAIALVREPWHAFLASATVGLGAAIAWPARDSFLATAVTPEQRSSVFGVRHATFNAGLGLGGILAAVVVDLSSPGTFEFIYVADALTFGAFAVLLFFLHEPKRPAPKVDVTKPSGYLALFRDPVFLRLWVLSAVLIAVGYGQFTSFFPAYATGEGGLSAGEVALAVAANTVTVVFAQLLVLRMTEGGRRTRAIVLMAALWAASWTITYVAGQALTGTVAVFVFALAMVVFGIGETLLSPTVPALVNDLAPDEARGRYNGANTLAWTIGFIVGPLVASALLDARLAGVLTITLVGGCVLAAVTALRLERRLGSEVNRVPMPDAVPVRVAEPRAPFH